MKQVVWTGVYLFSLTGEPLFELGSRGHVHGTLAVTVGERGVGAVAEQERAHLHAVLGSRLVQRGELPQVHGVDAGAMLQRHNTASS